MGIGEVERYELVLMIAAVVPRVAKRGVEKNTLQGHIGGLVIRKRHHDIAVDVSRADPNQCMGTVVLSRHPVDEGQEEGGQVQGGVQVILERRKGGMEVVLPCAEDVLGQVEQQTAFHLQQFCPAEKVVVLVAQRGSEAQIARREEIPVFLVHVGGVGEFQRERESVARIVQQAYPGIQQGIAVRAEGRLFKTDVDILEVVQSKEGVGGDARISWIVQCVAAQQNGAAESVGRGAYRLVMDEIVVGYVAVAPPVGIHQRVELSMLAVERCRDVGVEINLVQLIAQQWCVGLD